MQADHRGAGYDKRATNFRGIKRRTRSVNKTKTNGLGASCPPIAAVPNSAHNPPQRKSPHNPPTPQRGAKGARRTKKAPSMPSANASVMVRRKRTTSSKKQRHQPGQTQKSDRNHRGGQDGVITFRVRKERSGGGFTLSRRSSVNGKVKNEVSLFEVTTKPVKHPRSADCIKGAIPVGSSDLR